MIVWGVNVEIHIYVEIHSPFLIVICWRVWLVGWVLWVPGHTACGYGVVYRVGNPLLRRTLEILCFVWSYAWVGVRGLRMTDRFQLRSTVIGNLSGYF